MPLWIFQVLRVCMVWRNIFLWLGQLWCKCTYHCMLLVFSLLCWLVDRSFCCICNLPLWFRFSFLSAVGWCLGRWLVSWYCFFVIVTFIVVCVLKVILDYQPKWVYESIHIELLSLENSLRLYSVLFLKSYFNFCLNSMFSLED